MTSVIYSDRLRTLGMGMVSLNPPKARTCLRCGREDTWNSDVGDWSVRVIEGEKQSGDRFCLHEWDITGSHKPIIEE